MAIGTRSLLVRTDQMTPTGQTPSADQMAPMGAVDGDGDSGRDWCSLADLAPGTRATVVRVEPASARASSRAAREATARRLGELGFTPGTVVEVVRRAPLRDPVVYRVRDYEICLRRTEAVYVRCARTTGGG